MTPPNLGPRHPRGQCTAGFPFFLVLLLAVSAAGIVPLEAQSPPPAGESPGGGPRMRVAQPEIDFGEVVRGETVEGTFEIENIGDESLIIEKAQPGCGCTLASYDAIIPPGATGTVRVALDTTKQRRTTGRYVTVYSNDPVDPRLQLWVRATVVGSVIVQPGERIQLGNRRNQQMEPAVLIRQDPTESGELTVSNVVSSSEWLEVDVERVEDSLPPTDSLPAAEPGDYVLRFKLAEDSPFFRGKETVTFETGLSRESRRELTLYVSYDAPVELSTEQVELGVGAEGAPAKETVLVKVRPGLEGDLTVEVDPPEMEVSLRDLGRRQYHADIRWTGGDRKVGSIYFVVGGERLRLPVVRQVPAATASR